jgi:hypothetical protein
MSDDWRAGLKALGEQLQGAVSTIQKITEGAALERRKDAHEAIVDEGRTVKFADLFGHGPSVPIAGTVNEDSSVSIDTRFKTLQADLKQRQRHTDAAFAQASEREVRLRERANWHADVADDLRAALEMVLQERARRIATEEQLKAAREEARTTGRGSTGA